MREGKGSMTLKKERKIYEGMFKNDKIVSGKLIDSKGNEFITK